MPSCQMERAKPHNADLDVCMNNARTKCRYCGKDLCYACAEICAGCYDAFCSNNCADEHKAQGQCKAVA